MYGLKSILARSRKREARAKARRLHTKARVGLVFRVGMIPGPEAGDLRKLEMNDDG